MKKITRYIMLLSVALCCLSCGDPPVVNQTEDEEPDVKENLLNANKYIIEGEETAINNYVERHGWQCNVLPCGVRVYETTVGRGGMVQNDDTVTVRYSAESLAGEMLYADTVVTYRAGRLQPTEGFDAAVLSLRYGSKANIIVPSYVGYGVVGDRDRIGARTPVAYHVEVLKR